MEVKKTLTNEKLQKRFSSLFELVNYAIDVAENMILTGREPNTETGVQNRAVQVLDEISKHKETFEEVSVDQIREPELAQPTRESIVQKAEAVQAEKKLKEPVEAVVE